MNELRPKLFDVMKGYTKAQLMKDIISGIIVAIIALPLSIALAIASGVGPEQGLYTAIIAGFFISFFGGSRVQIGGPTAAFVVIIYGIVVEYGTDGLIVATILAGIILVIMGICRFGSLIKYIPYTITTGFTCGIAVTLFVGQLKDFFGMDIASVPSEFLDKLIIYGKNIRTVNVTATLIGLLAVAIMFVWPKITDKIPGSLIAIIVTTAIVYFAKLPVNTIGSVYGQLNSAFPAFHVPAISMKLVQQMLSPAFTIAVLAAIESLLSAVVSDGMIGDTHKSNAELIGQGLGNIFSGLFCGIPELIAKFPASCRVFFVPDFPAAHMLGVNSSHDGRNRHESASELLPSHAAASALSVQTALPAEPRLPVLSADAEGRFIAANPRQRAGVAAPRVCGAVRRRFAGGCKRATAARRRYGVR